MIRGMHHVGISVVSLERSMEFYARVFGLTPLAPPETFQGRAYERLLGLPAVRGRVVLLAGNAFRVELFEFECPQPQGRDPGTPVSNHGLSHFCVEVDSIDRLYNLLVASGVRAHCEPLFFQGEGSATYIRDPDGNVIEIFEPGSRAP